MRKTLLLSLLLLVCGVVAKAQAPQVSTDEAPHYYTLYCAKSQVYFATETFSNGDLMVSKPTATSGFRSYSDPMIVKLVESSEGYFYMQAINIEAYKSQYIGVTNVVAGQTLTFVESASESAEWKTELVSNTNNKYYIKPKSNNSIAVVLWSSGATATKCVALYADLTNAGTYWEFYEQPTLSDIETAYGTVGDPGSSENLTSAIATYKSSKTDDNYLAMLTAYEAWQEQTDYVMPASDVVYKITSAFSSFSSTKDLLAGETSGAMDLRWGGSDDNLNTHYWTIVDGKLKNGNGYYVTYNGTTGNQANDAVFSMTTNPEEAASVQFNAEGAGKFAITFSNGTNTSNALHVSGHSSGSGTAGNIIAFNENTGTSSWRFTPIAENLKAYTVVLVDAPEEATVTRMVGGVTETAFNGGFFMASGETFDGTLAATHIDGYTAGEPAIDNAAKTITVKYTHNLTEYVTLLTEANDNAKALLAKTGVGYPKADDEKRLALETLTENITTALQTPEVSLDYTEAEALETALEAYTVSTNVQMPEDGKTYTFTGVLHDGRKRYLNYNGTSAYTLVDYTEGDALPSTAQFICRKDGDHYVFTNNAGKYFLWYGSGEGYDGNDGVQDAYDEHTHFTIDKLVKGTNADVVVDSDAELFGYMCIKGQRNNTNSAYQQSYFILKKTGGLDRASAQFFKDSHSSAFLIEEVTTDSPSQVKFSANLSGVGYVATYSAPYPTVVPEGKGVVAYYASQNTGSDVTMTPIEGAIPANTGVVLISESAQTVGMAPLAAAAPEALTTNLLRHSAGAAATVSAEEGKTAYILANGSEGVGFYAHDGSATQLKMNKSYLVIDTPTGGNAVKLVFGGTATGIEDAVEADDEAAPVYDLSGRKVSAPVKGGIYVKNGKKIIF